MEAIHTGEHLAEELCEMDISAAEFSRQFGVPTNRITQIVAPSPATPPSARLLLRHHCPVLAEPASLYEIRLAEQESGSAIRALPTLKTFQSAHS